MSLYSTYQFIKQAVASAQEILDAAVKYYDNDDPEDPKRRWDHVLDDIEVAKKIRGRDLTPVELATLAFHDSGYKNPKGYMWGLKNHPKLSRKIFMREAPALGFTPEEIKHMAKVISYHMRTPKKNSRLLKDDLQMLMFGADEGTPKKPVDDARKYFMKAVAGRYPEVPDKRDPQFIKKLVERVRTFHDYSDAPGLAYYHQVYPDYHRNLYNYWHSDQIEKDYEQMLADELAGKSIKQSPVDLNWSARTPLEDEVIYSAKQAAFDLPDLEVNPKSKITRLLKDLKWGLKRNGNIVSDYDTLFDLSDKDTIETIGDEDVDALNIASCVDKVNRVSNNAKGIGALATFRSDWEIPHITPLFKYKGKYYTRNSGGKYSSPYDSLDEIGDRWYRKPVGNMPIPDYVDFYDLPAGTILETKDIRKILDEVKQKSGKSYRKHYKQASKQPDISDIVNAYKEQYGIDLSHMKPKWSKYPRYNNGKIAKDIPVDSYGGSWAKNNTIYLNPDLQAVMKYYGLEGSEDNLRRTISAHELAHEIYKRQATQEFIKNILAEAKKKKFNTVYLDTVPEHKRDEETFCEYLANNLKQASKDITFPSEEIDSLKGKDHLYTTRVSSDYDKYNLGDTVTTPWGDNYVIDSEDIYDDVKKHKFYDELTDEQKKLLSQYRVMKLLGLTKKASRLYTYVDPDADLSQGLLSLRNAPEFAIINKYKNRVKDPANLNKEYILNHIAELDPSRPDWVYAFDAPIPDKANDGLIRFRDTHKLVSWDPEQVKDLIKILRRYHNPKTREEVSADFTPLKYMRWNRDKDGMSMRHAPVYKILTESGRIPPELLREE